jgi:hypothetical protein
VEFVGPGVIAGAVVVLPTAPRNDPYSLAVVAGAFVFSLLPFLVTNYLVSGNPLYPPRLLSQFTGVESASTDAVNATVDCEASDRTGTRPGNEAVIHADALPRVDE